MCVYNGQAFLAEAMNSVLGQAFSDFECLVVDDYSTDRTLEILAGYAVADPRVVVVCNEENLGLTHSLNRGLGLIRGRYVARMDADDVCRPDRLERQVAFMEAHPEVAILGSWVEIFGDLGEHIWTPPVDDKRLCCEHLFNSSIYHPVAMYRTAFFQEYGVCYNTEMTCSQDYELWVRVSRLGGRLANLPEPLLRFRMHGTKIGVNRLEEQDRCADKVRRWQLEELGILPTMAELEIHRAIATRQYIATLDFFNVAGEWLARLATANRERRIFPEPDFVRLLGERYLEACSAVAEDGWVVFRHYRSRPDLCSNGSSAVAKARLLLKCLLRWGRPAAG
ncbi:putative Glycosyltransferase [Desulfovibrionales bacterium]